MDLDQINFNMLVYHNTIGHFKMTKFLSLMETKIKHAIDQLFSRNSTEWRAKYIQIKYALHVNKNYLLEKYSLQDLVRLNNLQLKSNLFEETIHTHAMYQHLAKTPLSDNKSLHTIVCYNCKENSQVTWRMSQTRSADEGFTYFCHCKTCGSRWKLS
jgi:DNA-directed RNA polymerase subunit M/transcription elongation factor TFIIS